MTPNRTMKIAPACLKIVWFSMKNFPKNDDPKPSTIKISENPIKKNSVCSIPLFVMRFESDFKSSNDMPVIYDKNAGYKGNVQGDMKLKKPAPKARNRFKSGAIILSPSIFSVLIVSKEAPEYVEFVCEQFMTFQQYTQ